MNAIDPLALATGRLFILDALPLKDVAVTIPVESILIPEWFWAVTIPWIFKFPLTDNAYPEGIVAPIEIVTGPGGSYADMEFTNILEFGVVIIYKKWLFAIMKDLLIPGKLVNWKPLP